MSSDHLVSTLSHSNHFQNMHKFPKILQKTRTTVVWKALGSGLFFLILALVASSALAKDVTLAWDSNSEPDVEGYGVYFSQGDPGPPYSLFGYVATNEFSDPDSPAFTLTGLEKGTRYYFAVTAYDISGNESDFSNSVCAEIGDGITPCVSADSGGGGSADGGGASAGSSSGSGSNGNGCFIGSASTDCGRFNPETGILAALGCMGALFWISKRRFSRLDPLRKSDSFSSQRRKRPE